MKKLVRDKRAINLLSGVVIFIILNVIFISALFFFVARAGKNVSLYEQIYAKQIVLVIDGAKPGTSIEIDVSELYEIARKNKFRGNIVNVDYSNNEIFVRLEEGKGYGFKYFSELNSGAISLDSREEKLHIEV